MIWTESLHSKIFTLELEEEDNKQVKRGKSTEDYKEGWQGRDQAWLAPIMWARSYCMLVPCPPSSVTVASRLLIGRITNS